MLNTRTTSSRGLLDGSSAIETKKVSRVDRIRNSMSLIAIPGRNWLAHCIGDILLSASASDNPVKMINTASSLLNDFVAPYLDRVGVTSNSDENVNVDDVPIKQFNSNVQAMVAVHAFAVVMTKLFAPFRDEDETSVAYNACADSDGSTILTEMENQVKAARKQVSVTLVEKLVSLTLSNSVFFKIMDDYLSYLGRASSLSSVDSTNMYHNSLATNMMADVLAGFREYTHVCYATSTEAESGSVSENVFLKELLTQIAATLRAQSNANGSSVRIRLATLLRVFLLNSNVREYVWAKPTDLNNLVRMLADQSPAEAGVQESDLKKLKAHVQALELIVAV
jgi:hypothetical protein